MFGAIFKASQRHALGGSVSSRLRFDIRLRYRELRSLLLLIAAA